MPGYGISKRPKQWINPRFKSRIYSGKYKKGPGGRELVLIESVKRKGKNRHKYVCESHEAAKALGWKAI